MEHLRYAAKNNQDTPVTRHYNETPPTLSDLRVTGLLHTSGSDFQHLIKEQHTIFKYGTLTDSNSNDVNI